MTKQLAEMLQITEEEAKELQEQIHIETIGELEITNDDEDDDEEDEYNWLEELARELREDILADYNK